MPVSVASKDSAHLQKATIQLQMSLGHSTGWLKSTSVVASSLTSRRSPVAMIVVGIVILTTYTSSDPLLSMGHSTEWLKSTLAVILPSRCPPVVIIVVDCPICYPGYTSSTTLMPFSEDATTLIEDGDTSMERMIFLANKMILVVRYFHTFHGSRGPC